jgi:rhodanese-related sulfurtransferase
MGEVTRVSPEEAYAKMKNEGFVYVDVRTEAEFLAGHPAGAYNVPIAEPDFVRVMLGHFGKDAKIVVGCRSGVRSLRAAETLQREGFRNVLDQRAGWDGTATPFGQITEKGWGRLDLPKEEGAAPGRSFVDLKG